MVYFLFQELLLSTVCIPFQEDLVVGIAIPHPCNLQKEKEKKNQSSITKNWLCYELHRMHRMLDQTKV